MIVVSHPTDTLQGDITVPGDKSISHRAVMMGAIAEGVTTVHGFLFSADCFATLKAFQTLGVVIKPLNESSIEIHGVGKYGLKKPQQTIDCGNSGTTLRLLAGILAAQSFDSELTGDNSLLKRPMERIVKPLSRMGAQLSAIDGRPPLRIHGVDALKGMTYEMQEASAQVKSSILFAGLYATGETQIIEPVASRDHTERLFASFSYPLHKTDNTITIHSSGSLYGTDIFVPGDISSAAFFIVAATLVPHSRLCIRNVGINPTRTGFLEILKQMGANITVSNIRQLGEEPVADIYVCHSPLCGIVIPESLVPLSIDEFPILFIAAACAFGETVLRGAKELRVKETDRIAVMAKGLTNLGIEVNVFDDGIMIRGGILTGGEVDSCYDHRIAMAFLIAGAIASSPIIVDHCEQVATSFPHFITVANQINLSMRVANHD